MSDLKMSCPGCDSWTSSVGAALRDGEACPYCGLPAEVTQMVMAAEERSADEALVRRALEAEKRAIAAESETQSLRAKLQAIADVVRRP